MLPFQPNIGRFLAAIRHEEPDCVPLADFQVDEPVMDQFMGRPVRSVTDHVAFQAKAGYDFIYLRANYEYHGASPAVTTGAPQAWQYARTHATESEGLTQDRPLRTLEDLDTYPWPDPQTVAIDHFTEASAALPPGLGIITGVGGVFTRTWMLMGYEHFCLSLADNPELVSRIARRIGSIQCAALRRLVQLPDIYAIWYGDDLACSDALLASPRVLRKHFFPWIEARLEFGRYPIRL